MNSRTRRQTRQSNETLQTAAATRTTRVTRSAAHAQQEEENIRKWFFKRLEALLKSKQITQEEHDRIIRDSADLKGEVLMAYLNETVGEEPLALGRPANGPSMLHHMQQQRSPNMMQPGSLANVAHQGSYTVQRMMNTTYGLAAMTLPGMPQPALRPLGFPPHRPFASGMMSSRMHQDAMGFPMHQRSMPRITTRKTEVPSVPTGEVAKTLIPGRTEGQQSGYPQLLPSVSSLYSVDLTAPQQMEMTPNKRPATPSTESVTKSARTGKSRRTAEDPSAPDANEMDVVTEAAIDVEEEQEALLNDVPSQGVTDADGQSIDSDILNVAVIRGRLQQLLREQGMQSNGIEVSDMILQGMEERFEAFLKSVVKRSMHRTMSGSIDRDSEIHAVSSEVRSKLREIKKKQEQHRAAKLREEREKLEQLAETASKKELANNKELAAKVERVKREKQFNAEAEAANRALSNALGDFGFDRIRKRKQDKQAKEAQTTALSQLPPNFPKTESVQTPTQRPVIVKTKDIVSIMTEDPVYAFSPILYRLCL